MNEAFYVHPAEARRQFREFAARRIHAGNLALGALLIALEEYPRLDVDACLAELDSLAAKVKERSSPGEPEIFRLGHLHSVLFDQMSFIGNSADYNDPRNVYLNEVLERRLGIPITLSILFLHVANSVKLNAVGVGLPGHYIVKVRFEMSEIYVDPFRGGATLTMQEIRDLVMQVQGSRGRFSGEQLRGWSERQTLMRVLANLQHIYSRNGDRRRSAAARERIELLLDLG